MPETASASVPTRTPENQALPFGPIVIAPESRELLGKLVNLPVGVTRSITLPCRFSAVNHRSPSGASAISETTTTFAGSAYKVMDPCAVIRPIDQWPGSNPSAPSCCANHIVLLGPGAMY